MRKTYIITFALAFMCTLFGATSVKAQSSEVNSSTGYTAVIDDSADYLDDSQEASIMELLNQITEYGNAVLITTESHDYYDTDSLCAGYFEDLFGTRADGVIFAIDRDLNKIYLVTEGSSRKTIPTSRCLTITDNTYIYATQSHGYDYYTCAYKTFSQVLTLYKGGFVAQPMKYITNILLALILAMILNYFLAMALSKPKKPSVKQVLDGVFTHVGIENAHVINIGQTKRYSPRSSGSSGGGGGHSGGGGGHSGGGHSI